ncbi:ATP-binding cassette domain-containing protein [Prolixibacter bellariivorans]|uniref:ATP-binding cassette domain-containing protein n=1 Tax=Prolixibacter bellariivorans TaxID=314319 RepID=UPI000470E3CB|nr:ATP-binding cassette domain-containing protein [Prolixibacter bellariivorans]
MENTHTPVIEVKEVHKSFKTIHAVQGLNLTIEKGQFVALLGPNGAGKTTLVEMIEGIRHPDKGEIRIMGKTWKPGYFSPMATLGASAEPFVKRVQCYCHGFCTSSQEGAIFGHPLKDILF